MFKVIYCKFPRRRSKMSFTDTAYRAGLPKKTQTYFFFQIVAVKVDDFRAQLTHLLPLITTTAQVIDDQNKIANAKKQGSGLVKLSGVNIVFSRKGFTVVSELCLGPLHNSH